MLPDGYRGAPVHAAIGDVPLVSVLDTAWTLLEDGVKKNRVPFHVMTLGTVDLDGAPSVRNVVLRTVDREHWRASFHTDIRSPKISHLRAHSRVALVAYSQPLEVQIRLAGRARIHHLDDVSKHAWNLAKPYSKLCYGSAFGSGELLDVARVPNEEPDFVEALAYERFVVVAIELDQLEWLHLSRNGHQRAAFKREQGRIKSHWIAP